MNLWVYLYHQIVWSRKTFGPGKRTKGIIEHIKKELVEVEENPDDLEEWCDLIILAMDGAWRCLGSDPALARPDRIIEMLKAKQNKNFARKWGPVLDEDHAVEHIKGDND